jgi:hypothetical protein
MIDELAIPRGVQNIKTVSRLEVRSYMSPHTPILEDLTSGNVYVFKRI